MALTLLCAVGIDFTSQFYLFTAIILVHNVFAATMDVAIDALAVTTLPPEERGAANGLMFAGAYLGNAIGGSGVLFARSDLGDLSVRHGLHPGGGRRNFDLVGGTVCSACSYRATPHR
jgi:MFS family permease